MPSWLWLSWPLGLQTVPSVRAMGVKRPAAQLALMDGMVKTGAAMKNAKKKAGKPPKVSKVQLCAGPEKVLIVPPPRARQCWFCGYRSGPWDKLVQSLSSGSLLQRECAERGVTFCQLELQCPEVTH